MGCTTPAAQGLSCSPGAECEHLHIQRWPYPHLPDPQHKGDLHNCNKLHSLETHSKLLTMLHQHGLCWLPLVKDSVPRQAGEVEKAEPSVQERMSLWRSEHPNPGRNICKKAGRCRAWENKGLRCFQIFHVTRSVRSANISKHERLFAGFTVNCSRGWGKTSTNSWAAPLLLAFLDVFTNCLCKAEHRDQKISTALLGIIHSGGRSASLHPNQTVLQPSGREHTAKQKQEFAAAPSAVQGSPTDGALPQQLLPVGDSQTLTDSPKESFHTTRTPIREAAATKILFVGSKLFTPKKNSWVCNPSREALLFCRSPNNIFRNRIPCRWMQWQRWCEKGITLVCTFAWHFLAEF